MIGAAALLVFVLSTAGLAWGIEPIPTWYFLLAWWPYIVGVDDLNRRRVGRGLLRDRPRFFVALCAVSVVWWTLFEAANLRLGNWYYVMDDPRQWVRWPAGVVAFATVLPGILVTLALFESVGRLASLPVRPLRWGPKHDRACVAVGVLCLVAPLLWPRFFFPAIWGSAALLLEPWNRRHAARSFLRDLQAGQAGPLLRTLLAGLVCGVLWELWNFWARTKWVYTLPGLAGLKVFEMPLGGFLGFPPFAVESVVVVRFLAAAWRRSLALGRTGRRLAAAGVGVAVAAVTLVVFRAADGVTVDSFYAPVAGLEVLPDTTRMRLVAAGLERPEDVVRELDTLEGRLRWLDRTRLPLGALAEAYDRTALVMHHGLGNDRALQLDRVGIRRLADLRSWSPDTLAAALRAAGAGTTGRDRFLDRRVRVWLADVPE